MIPHYCSFLCSSSVLYLFFHCSFAVLYHSFSHITLLRASVHATACSHQSPFDSQLCTVISLVYEHCCLLCCCSLCSPLVPSKLFSSLLVLLVLFLLQSWSLVVGRLVEFLFVLLFVFIYSVYFSLFILYISKTFYSTLSTCDSYISIDEMREKNWILTQWKFLAIIYCIYATLVVWVCFLILYISFVLSKVFSFVCWYLILFNLLEKIFHWKVANRW
jgi:hypothetical protein